MSSDFLTVVQVSRQCGVSARMLRHYEKMGLIQSLRSADYAYRLYDEGTVDRIRMILLLRKLRLPLKDIALILKADGHEQILQTLRRHLAEMDGEIASLTLIRDALSRIAGRCALCAPSYCLLEDAEALRLIDALTAPATNIIQEEITMTSIDHANEILNHRMDVRILQLPPMTVAAGRAVGENPEEAVGDCMSRFVQESGLYAHKPDARMFGFNSPDPGVLPEGHGYEVWITIPEDFALPEEIERKQMKGGLYAALAITFPEFHRWQELLSWAEASPDYAPAFLSGPENMHGLLEEHVNWVHSAAHGWENDRTPGHIDLLLPIRRRTDDQ